jgi:hypothetical protein
MAAKSGARERGSAISAGQGARFFFTRPAWRRD